MSRSILRTHLKYILVINLEHRVDRWNRMHEWLSQVFPEWEESKRIIRWPAQRVQPGYKGCTLSHLACAEFAWLETRKDCKSDTVLILEDDCEPIHYLSEPEANQEPEAETKWNPTEFRETLESSLNALTRPVKGSNRTERVWDMLMISMTPIRIQPRNDPNHNLVSIQQSLGLPGYLVRRSYLTTLIFIFQQALREHTPHDVVMQLYQSKNESWWGFFPAIAHQAPGYSDIEQQYQDYSHLDIDGSMIVSK